jgi:TniB protein/TniQ protein
VVTSTDTVFHAEEGPVDLSHLYPAAQRIARLPDEEWLRQVRADRWIGYTRATEALNRLETLLSWPAKQRMPNLLLIGPTNNGKSMIIEKFRRTHLPVSHQDREEIPVLVVQMPSEPSVGRFYTALLAASGAPLRPRQRVPEQEQLALSLLRAAGVRVLVIDELHNVLAGRGDTRREFLNLLRFLGNELRIPLVGVGTRDAYLAIRSDDQLRRPVGEPVPAVHAAALGTRRGCLLAAGQFRRRIPAAPALADRGHRDGRLPADPQRRHHRRAGPPAHRRRRRRDRIRRGGHQPAHPADGRLRGPGRAAPVVRARTGVSTRRAGGRRWPLHPRPEPGEALSSWLERIARCYGFSVADLLRHNLGPASALLGDAAPADLDWDPATAVLTALGERTGVPPGELRWMTMAGWVPWLTDALDACEQRQAVFDTYVRQNSVLLAPGEAGRNTARRWRTWRGPWLPAQPRRRVCPECAKDPQRGTALMWRLPIMTGCGEHGCRLEPQVDVNLAALDLAPLTPAPVDPLVAELDRRTHEGVTTGAVTLPGRVVHVAVWFRLLRTLLDEVSISLSRVGIRSRATLEQVWQATGRLQNSLFRPVTGMLSTGVSVISSLALFARIFEIDGTGLRDLRLADLAAIVGVVSQETYLLHTTVRETCATPSQAPPTPRSRTRPARRRSTT